MRTHLLLTYKTIIIMLLLSFEESAGAGNRSLQFSAEQWRMVEIVLHGENNYDDPFNEVEITAVFKGPRGEEIKRPAFWDGGNTWKIRFAPTKSGKWEMMTYCNVKRDKGLHKIKARINVREYEGDLSIYRHGFLRISEGGRYFVYDDGTPFFYLGDTHWCFVHERFSTSNAPGIPSQFCYTVDKRVEQGFTVYQSEAIQKPHGGVHKSNDEEDYYNLSDGFSEKDLAGFRNMDRKFQYIADQGLVHANSQLFWVMEPVNAPICTNSYMYKLGRYWAARYGAYPVLWTVAQEVDKDMNGRLDEQALVKWRSMSDGLTENDDYHHPLTAHMLNVVNTNTSNSWWGKLPYHSWWGVQWKGEMTDVDSPKNFWEYSHAKPAILYESAYENFSTDATGAVKAGYIAFQSGLYGYGYGANGIWNDLYSYSDDEYDCGTPYMLPERYVNWYEGANLEGASLLKFMREFYQENEWWKLTPRFDDTSWAEFADTRHTALASNDNERYVVLFFGNGFETGVLKQLEDGMTYTVKWYNPMTGEYSLYGSIVAKNTQFLMPNKPNAGLWLLVVTENNI